MASQKQIDANIRNAQLSTGPTSEAGRQISSRNAIRHGLTSRRLTIREDQQEAYRTHLDNVLASYPCTTPRRTELATDIANLRWSIHEAFAEETGYLALMADIREKADTSDPLATLQALREANRQLATVIRMENSKRRAVAKLEAELAALVQADLIQAQKEARAKQQPGQSLAPAHAPTSVGEGYTLASSLCSFPKPEKPETVEVNGFVLQYSDVEVYLDSFMQPNSTHLLETIPERTRDILDALPEAGCEALMQLRNTLR